MELKCVHTQWPLPPGAGIHGEEGGARPGHAPLEGAEWREQAGELCGVKEGTTDAVCLTAYRAEVGEQYRLQLREARRVASERGGGRGGREGEEWGSTGERTGRAEVVICNSDVRAGLPNACPRGCDVPGSTGECVLVSNRGALGNPFVMKESGPGGQTLTREERGK